MSTRKVFAATIIAWTPLLALFMAGCGGGGSPSSIHDPKGEAAHIAGAAGHVGAYMSENKGKVPASTDEIKDWAAQKSIPDDSLVSTRDHEPYEVHQVTMGGMGKALILIEKQGSKGKKFVFHSMNPNKVGSESTEEEIKTMLKGTGPPTRGRGN